MIDLAAAKTFLKDPPSEEDALVQASINAAISAVQNATGKPFAAAEFTQTLDGFPRCNKAILLRKGPVSPDTPAPSIKYDDVDGVEQTLADFRLVEAAGAAAKLLPAYGASWPATAIGEGSVRVTYTAGYDGGEGVPADLDQAVLLLVGHYYSNREAVVEGDRAAAVELPLGVQALLAPYAIPGIA